jgi:putative transcriptional regulator
MTKTTKVAGFREQFRLAMGELQAIVDSKSLDRGGHYTVRTIEVAEPSEYDAKRVRATREALGLSQAVFANLVGVSTVLVRSWERGARHPAPIARRLLDQMRANPKQFAALVKPIRISPASGGGQHYRVAAKTTTSSRRSA